MWETWVRSLGREDPLEKEMATHSSILAWRIPWMEELGGLQSTGHKESDTTEWLHFHFHFVPRKENYDKPRQHIKKQRHHFSCKGPYGHSNSFPSSHVWMWEVDHKEGWVPKNWYFQIVVLEKSLESPLDIKEIKPVHPKGNQPWIFIGGTYAEAEFHYFGHLMQRADLLEKILMLGKIEGKRKGGQQRLRRLESITDSMDMNLSELWKIVKERGRQRMRWLDGWHHWLNRHEFEQAPGDGKGQGWLACCRPWGCKESDMT